MKLPFEAALSYLKINLSKCQQILCSVFSEMIFMHNHWRHLLCKLSNVKIVTLNYVELRGHSLNLESKHIEFAYYLVIYTFLKNMNPWPAAMGL